MIQRISPARRLSGCVHLPGDKSISHRYAMLAGIAEGTTRIRNYATGADCASTLSAMQALGAVVQRRENEVILNGAGLDGLRQPSSAVDAGNSGSTIRMLAGIAAGCPFTTCIAGDESLSRRPMERIIRPLEQMGASIKARDGRFPPLEICGGNLHPIDYALPVPSAQVKTCVLFAGLHAEGATIVRELVRTRDHTEIALREFGANLQVAGNTITLQGRPRLQARDLAVPGDLSSAAFFLVAALLTPESSLTIESVGLNPTRSALVDFLVSMGARIGILNPRIEYGEPVGDLLVESSHVKGGVVEKQLTAALIDEIPVLAVLGAASEGGLIVRNAAELRVKETDRIASLAENFKRMGLAIEVSPDGFQVPGRQRFRAAGFDSYGDHRIAMTFAVAALCADAESTIASAEAAAVSFPEFFQVLSGVAK